MLPVSRSLGHVSGCWNNLLSDGDGQTIDQDKSQIIAAVSWVNTMMVQEAGHGCTYVTRRSNLVALSKR